MKKLLLLFAFALLSITGFSQDKDWFKVYSDDDEVIEIRLSSIKRNGNTVKGWVKTTYLGRSHIDQRLQQLYEVGLEEYGGKWKNWDHSMHYSEYNFIEGYTYTICIVDYSKDGSAIKSYDFDRNNSVIVPDSRAYVIAYYLCGKAILTLNGKRYEVYLENFDEFISRHPNAEYVGVTHK